MNEELYCCLEYFPSTNFCEVPVFPPIEINSENAFVPVPFLTTPASKSLIKSDVSEEITLRISFGSNSFTKSPSAVTCL